MKSDNHEIQDRGIFNKIAGKYFIKDVYPVSSQARKFQLFSLTELLDLKSKKQSLGTILELGCGVGASAQYLCGYFNKYIGVDYSEEFIDLANANFANRNIEFHCANIKDFHISGERADFVFGVGVLHHVDDIEKVIKNLERLGDQNTAYGFIEPQASNPIIQMLRRIRMIVDKSYSDQQVFFKKKYIKSIFERNGFKIVTMKYQGYFTPPFAQIIIKPLFIFQPVIAMLIKVDRIIQKYFSNPLAWNIIWIATQK